jgi:hypothetical protein
MGATMPSDGPSEPMPTSRLLTLAVLIEGGLGVLAWALGWVVGLSPGATLTWRSLDVGVGLAATMPMLVLFGVMARSRWRPLARIRRFLVRAVGMMFGSCSGLDLALIAAAAGIGEELLFRGLIQGALGRWLGAAPALIAASLVFGLAHLITPLYAVLATLLGAYLGALWLLTGNLLSPIAAHAAYDFLALVWLVRRWRRRWEASPAG